MNQTIQQMRSVREALRQRTAEARAEFNAKPRFAVIPHGNNLFGVLDRQVGTERAEVAGHNKACQFAESLEKSAAFTRNAQKTAGTLASRMTRWVLVFSVVMVSVALLGIKQ